MCKLRKRIKRKKKRRARKWRKKCMKLRNMYIRDGIKFELKDANINIRNIRSKEEHDAFLKNVKENRPILLNQIKEQIDRVVLEINRFDKLYVLGGLSYISAMNQDDDGISEVSIEYGQSIAMATPNKSTEIPKMSDIENIYNHLVTIRHLYNWYILSESVEGKHSEHEYRLRREIMTESLYVRGDGYLQHIHEIFLELFEPHNEVIYKKYGFKANDILQTFIQLEDSFCTRIVYPDGKPHDISYIRFKEWMQANKELIDNSTNKNFIELYAENNPDIAFENGQLIHFSYDDITSYELLFKVRPFNKTQLKVIEELALNFGDNNIFLKPDKFKAFILNESLVYTKPIVKFKNEYYYFAFNIPSRNLIRIGETLLKKADKDYFQNHYLGNKYSKTRDNYIEKKSIELLSAFLPSVQFYRNNEYTIDLKKSPIYCNEQLNKDLKELTTELDILGISGKAIYLVEIKAGELNNSARRGSVLSLSESLSELLGYAACQSFRAHMHIKNSEPPAFKNKEKGELRIDKEGKKVFKICITLELLAGFITNLYHLKKLDIIEEDIEYPWAVSIFDLFIFSEIIDSEEDFMEYLNRRSKLNELPQIYIGDEIDTLGHFLKRGLEFSNNEIDGKDFIMLTGFKSEIDDYYNNLLAGIPCNKPLRIKNQAI